MEKRKPSAHALLTGTANIEHQTSLPPDSDDGPKDHHMTLRESFDMIDSDKSGTITAGEFGKLLRLQGEDVTDEDAKVIIAQIDIDGDTTNLTFEEFTHIMEDIKHMHEERPGDKFSLAQAFVEQTKHRSETFQDKDPLYVRYQRELAAGNTVQLSSTMNARMKVASLIDGNTMQVIVLVLVFVDVVCVILELTILFTKCPCNYSGGGSSNGDDSAYSAYGSGSSYGGSSYGGSSYDTGASYSSYERRLEEIEDADTDADLSWSEWWDKLAWLHDNMLPGSGRALAGGACPKTGYQFSEVQHDWEVYLNLLSVSILLIFAMQISALLFLYGFDFFKNVFYSADFVIVYGALLLETTHIHGWFHVQGGGLFVLLLFWRIVRVIHGFATSVEMHHAKLETKITADRNKMHELIVISRRKGAAQKMFFSEYHEALVEAGVEAGKFAATDEGQKIQRNMLIKSDEGVGATKSETKRLLMAERRRRKKAESMYMDAYAFYHEHIEGLQDHVIAIGLGHGEEDDGNSGHH